MKMYDKFREGDVADGWNTDGKEPIAHHDRLKISIHNTVRNHPVTGNPLYNFPLFVEERTVGIAPIHHDHIGLIAINRPVFATEVEHDRYIAGEQIEDCIGSIEIETPRGMAKPDETFEEAGAREVEEEVRRKVDSIRLASQYQLNSTFWASAPGLLVAQVSDEPTQLEEDDMEFISKYKFIHTSHFFEMIRAGIIKDGFAQSLSAHLLLGEYSKGIPTISPADLDEKISDLREFLHGSMSSDKLEKFIAHLLSK